MSLSIAFVLIAINTILAIFSIAEEFASSQPKRVSVFILVTLAILHFVVLFLVGYNVSDGC